MCFNVTLYFYQICFCLLLTVCKAPIESIQNGTKRATKTTELADGTTVEDKWKFECDGGFLLIHSQDGVVECSSDTKIDPSDIPRCVKS